MLWYTGLVAEQYKRHPNTQCFVCKKLIYKRPAEIKINKGRIFCSTTCYGKSCRKEIECVVCGKLILSGLNKKTCSRTCANKNRVGLLYKINKPKDKVSTLRRIKVQLLALRGEQCERCGYSKKEVLQIHHKNRDRTNNDLANLELICPNCHYEEHYLSKFKRYSN